MKTQTKLFTLFVLLASLASAQTEFTSPGNGVDLGARIFYRGSQTPCPSCPLVWSTVINNTIGALVGSHNHTVVGSFTGTFLSADISTNSNGWGYAHWTSKMANDNDGVPMGYAMRYGGVSVYSPVADNGTQILSIQVEEDGLVPLTPPSNNAWYKTSDTTHNSKQYYGVSGMNAALNSIAQKFYTASGHKLMVIRGSLPLGGIYDGWTNGAPFWAAGYVSSTSNENHMFGDEVDISLIGMTVPESVQLDTAISTTKFTGGVANCQYWQGFYAMLHVFCPTM
jgi:hypothetical protein